MDNLDSHRGKEGAQRDLAGMPQAFYCRNIPRT
jgi:hypothetical protein